jgi:O-antigen/teichoic acid export membrane protein
LKGPPTNQAGSALGWRAVQFFGEKLIFFVRLLVLARMLTPDDFGLFAIAVTVTGFFLSISDLGMIPALVQAQDIKDEQYDVSWTVGIARGLLISGLIIVTAPLIANIFAEPRVEEVVQVLALRPLVDSFVSIWVADLNRSLRFKPLAILKLTAALANTIASIALASAFGIWALVAGVLTGAIANLFLSYILAPYRPRLSFDLDSARPLIRFGRWIFINSLIALAGGYVLRIAISRQLGAAELGIYYLAAQVAYMPAEIASLVIGEVAFPLIARIQADIKQVTRAFRMMLIGSTALFYPASVLTIALAPSFVEEILGPKWAGTESVIRILSLATMIGLFGEVVVPILKGLGRPYNVTVVELVQAVLLISLVWGLTSRFGIAGAAFAWIPAVTVSQFLSAYFIKPLLLRPFATLSKSMLAIIIATFCGAVIAFVVVQFIPGLVGFGLAISLALFAITFILWFSERRFSLGLFRDLPKMFPQVSSIFGLRY